MARCEERPLALHRRGVARRRACYTGQTDGAPIADPNVKLMARHQSLT